MLQNADRIGCRKYLSPSSLVAGNPKLNLAFVAHLFNTHPGLEPLEESEAPPEVEDFDAEGEREARVFTLWLNSLDVEPGVYNLFEDLKDGSVILQAFDKVVPGSVVWRRVTKPKEGQEISRFKAVENTNYAVDLASANGMRMVGIQGADIVDGTKTLVLGLVWQLMRLNIDKTLASLSRNGKGVTDTEIVRWANDTVKGAGKSTAMRSLRDPSLRNGHFFLDLVDTLRPGIVDQSLVEQGNSEDECILNGTSVSLLLLASAFVQTGAATAASESELWPVSGKRRPSGSAAGGGAGSEYIHLSEKESGRRCQGRGPIGGWPVESLTLVANSASLPLFTPVSPSGRRLRFFIRLPVQPALPFPSSASSVVSSLSLPRTLSRTSLSCGSPSVRPWLESLACPS